MIDTLKKKKTVLMFCSWQFQKAYFNLIPVKEMSLNDVASLNVKQKEVGRKKAIRSRAPIIPKMQRSNYQINIYCKLDMSYEMFYSQQICYLYTRRQQIRRIQTIQLQHLKHLNRLTTCFTDLSKIQSHCNNKATSTCGLILT